MTKEGVRDGETLDDSEWSVQSAETRAVHCEALSRALFSREQQQGQHQ